MVAPQKHSYAIFVVLMLFALALARSVAVEAPLGHDESVYAVGARALLEGTPSTGFDLHRPVGMRWLAAAGIALGGSESALRSMGVLFSLGSMLAFYGLGRRVIGTWPAVWASACWLSSENLLRRASELLTDLPSTCLTLLLMLVVVRECERKSGPSWWFALCAPIAAATFYVRYGTILGMAGMAVAAGMLWREELLRARAIVAATVAAFLVALVPHFFSALSHTGSLLGIIKLGGKAAGRKYLGEGLRYYWDRLPHAAFGTILTALALLGFVYGAWLLWTRTRDRRSALFVWAVAVFHTLATGLLVHGEPRYIFLGVLLLAMLGVRAIADALTSEPKVPVVIGGVLVLLVAFHDASYMATRKVRRYGDGRRQVVAAAAWIRQDAGGEPCAIASSYVPQMTWYAACSSRIFDSRNPAKGVMALKAKHRYAILLEKGKRQPSGEKLARMLKFLETTSLQLVSDPAGARTDAKVYVLPVLPDP